MDSVSEKAMYEDATTTVRVNGRESKAFSVRVGVHQGSVQRPFLLEKYQKESESRSLDPGPFFPCLFQVFQAKILSKLTYAAPAWWGFASVRDITRINCFLKKAKKMKFYPLDGLTIEELWRQSDDKLFKSITTNDKHVLYKF